MIGFRSFRNDDPPRLAELWRAAELGPNAVQAMSPALLEAAVFSKPSFERAGLVVAYEEDRIVGFAHAAFGPREDRAAIDTRCGTTALVVVPPHGDRVAIGAGLLERSEHYLRGRGAEQLWGGGTPESCGFYRGLYGGSDLPGVLDSTPAMQAVFRAAGYAESDRIDVMRRSLVAYRPPVNRVHLAIRRSTVVHAVDEPCRRDWWEAATTTGLSLRRYELRTRDEKLLGTATYWDMQPLASAWGVNAAGLLDVDVVEPRRRQGFASYLLGESLHDLAEEGVSVVETHVPRSNATATCMFDKLGFQRTNSGILFARR